MKLKALFKHIFLIFVISACGIVVAKDVVIISNSESAENDKRSEHKNAVIRRALELTENQYGPFQFRILSIQMNSHRALPVTIKGSPTNIYISAENEAWNNNTIAIKIPIRRGLLAYRLLLINKVDQDKFAAIKSIDDLKLLNAGLRKGWATANAFKKLGMKYTETNNFDGLFILLNQQRFHYIPRAIYEVFDELESRQHFLDNVMIEPTLALYLPMSTYVYVSPQFPRIAKRLEAGLNIMLENGDLERIFNDYYADEIERAGLAHRRLITYDGKAPNPIYLNN